MVNSIHGKLNDTQFAQPLHAQVEMVIGGHKFVHDGHEIINAEFNMYINKEFQFSMDLIDIDWDYIENLLLISKTPFKIDSLKIIAIDADGTYIRTSVTWKNIMVTEYTPNMARDYVTLSLKGISQNEAYANMLQFNTMLPPLSPKETVIAICTMIKATTDIEVIDIANPLLDNLMPSLNSTNGKDRLEMNPASIMVEGTLQNTLKNFLINHPYKKGNNTGVLTFKIEIDKKTNKKTLSFESLNINDSTQSNNSIKTFTYIHDKTSDLIEWNPSINTFGATMFGLGSIQDTFFDETRGLIISSMATSKVLCTDDSEKSNAANIAFKNMLKKINEIDNKWKKALHNTKPFSARNIPNTPTIGGVKKISKNSLKFNNYKNIESYKKLQSLMTVEATATIVGNPNVRLHEIINIRVLQSTKNISNHNWDIKKPSKHAEHFSSGLWLITGITHVIQGGSWTTKLNLVRSGIKLTDNTLADDKSSGAEGDKIAPKKTKHTDDGE